MSAQKKPIHAGSTQKFTEVEDIVETIVILAGGNACSVIEVHASNFALLSIQEQEAKIYSYAGLLNSLSFAIQIIIQNKKIDLSSYLELLEAQTQKAGNIYPQFTPEQNQLLITQIRLYKDFIQQLIKVNTVLDKKFYIIIPFSYLEKGISGAATAARGKNAKETFFIQAKSILSSKTTSVLSQLSRVGLVSKLLGKEDLIKLFYEFYNQTPPPDQITENPPSLIQGQQNA